MMKKLLFTIFGIMSICILFISCSYGMDYREACRKENWSEAYKIVDKLKEESQDYYVKWQSANGTRHKWAIEAEEKYYQTYEAYIEAYRYVVFNEAWSVLEESGTNGIVRVIGIAKENKAEDWLFEELIKTAQQAGDHQLAEALQNALEYK